ncbi:aconitate hydratase AcnA [Paenibacillus thiaminolyticus]|uniref:Aconitate hydratase n=1 Tax=Paenibacillus thiaminolyticus TaxID=49283 RepID=A0AAP9DWB5_PANTH|nr:aconitate hydratase AcnA [Paenibacillus thiaminolyticus]MCY9534005.1 aconitate hydratase AcnA [Paenibacillus thiaminolyticus]MCY9603766.1 aconitate hydratase AcnA [Paenibacillus thiaminolyticus]MCY9610315.1 aconitate hydratase AcnA [Paenibacillus thiaminolyticus]MCY9614523.1 aconitate hydratase AcnA [Paenibacillus thiaminolyticus]MCY9618948.1 aconitate hydratase AcnA [Paenibacillus thiaminolyticus]
MARTDAFSTARELKVDGKSYRYYSLEALGAQGYQGIDRLPFSIKVLLEAAVRQFDGRAITKDHVNQIAKWAEGQDENKEIPFIPSRIVLQDFTGVPVVVDLAAMRDTVKKAGGDPKRINPLVPVDLVIDHSVMVDAFGSDQALEYNMNVEFERNEERYRFLRWAQTAFDNFRAVPPATGIVHQVNLEYLASVAATKEVDGVTEVFPDSLVGTDSHTTMINGLGVVGWGVGGIEAEAGMLGQPLYFITPEVIGFKLTGTLAEGATATDLALTVTQMLRKKGVVGKFVEFFGPGLESISLADRATVANMAPEYGATIGFFPVDHETLNYLRLTGRTEEQVALVEAYYKAQGMFRYADTPDPVFTDIIELDLSSVVPSLAGPKRPQDRVELSNMKQSFLDIVRTPVDKGGYGLSDSKIEQKVPVSHPNGETSQLSTGAVVIAAITSCTNTSNPSVMIGAGLVAKKAVERGLRKPAYVKSSLTPGSLVVTEYLKKSGLMDSLEQLGFHVAGYGCATCIGNSGPLPDEVGQAIADHDMTVAAVLSGNRNFEGRIHAQVKANYLASPPLVVAYALAGTVNIDLDNEPIGYDKNNQPVYLKDIWPSSEEIKQAMAQAINASMFRDKYEHVFTQNERWNAIPVPEGELYEWDGKSTYIQNPPFFENLGTQLGDIADIENARVLALLGDSVTTDHISPAGNIKADSPAGEYLIANGVQRKDFNSYGSRRGNHEVMMRGTFANIRIRNQVAPGTEGGVTKYLPNDEIMSIYDASMKYQGENTNLVVLAGKEYGTGSSRDWAAKGTYLLGVKAVIAESFERIHRSNLVGMGVLPLQFQEGHSWKALGIDGTEVFSINGLSNDIQPGQTLQVTATRQDGTTFEFPVTVRLDSMVDVDYYHNGGILQTVLRQMIAGEKANA